MTGLRSKSQKNRNAIRTKWQRMAIDEMSEGELDRFYERSGILQFDAGMSEEEADRRAFMEVMKHD